MKPDPDIQKLLAEANEGVPQWEPTEEELNRMAAIDEERWTEGRRHRPMPQNPHDP